MKSLNSPVLISACLLGLRCRFNGHVLPSARIDRLPDSVPIISICPEQLGGLDTPRPPCQCYGGDGRDVWLGRARVAECNDLKADRTEAFPAGAERALKMAKTAGAKKAILKSRSPSCGISQVYQDGQLKAGMGVTAALLHSEGISVEEADA